jgi:hypothetical protein
LEKRLPSKSAVETIEEAVQCLRNAPFSLLLIYYLGSVPFGVALLYFWTDTFGGAVADAYVGQAAVGMIVTYIWMKFWQSIFAARLLNLLTGRPNPAFSARRAFRIIVHQTIVQPSSFWVLLLAFVLMLPFGWACAFYHNFSLTADGGESDVRKAARRAWQLAAVWPGQNHAALALHGLFSIVVFLDVALVVLTIPYLANSLLGLQTGFTRAGIQVVNSTFFLVVWVLSYQLLNPVIKTFYVLRCFYAESVGSGLDLLAELNRCEMERGMRARNAIPAVVLFCALLSWPASVQARAAGTGVNPRELDRAIEKVLQKREYRWRIPQDREKQLARPKGIVGRFFDSIVRWTKKIASWLGEQYDRFRNWLRSLIPDRQKEGGGPPGQWEGRVSYFVLLLAVVVSLFVLGYWWIARRRRALPDVLAATPFVAAERVADEDVAADELPEEEWQKLARELLQRGELRLALRAMYLALLAHLARLDLIHIARYKSNLDYRRELQRRAHDRVGAMEAFSDNILLFERTWYGRHDVTENLIRQFEDNGRNLQSLLSARQTPSATSGGADA